MTLALELPSVVPDGETGTQLRSQMSAGLRQLFENTLAPAVAAALEGVLSGSGQTAVAYLDDYWFVASGSDQGGPSEGGKRFLSGGSRAGRRMAGERFVLKPDGTSLTGLRLRVAASPTWASTFVVANAGATTRQAEALWVARCRLLLLSAASGSELHQAVAAAVDDAAGVRFPAATRFTSTGSARAVLVSPDGRDLDEVAGMCPSAVQVGGFVSSCNWDSQGVLQAASVPPASPSPSSRADGSAGAGGDPLAALTQSPVAIGIMAGALTLVLGLIFGVFWMARAHNRSALGAAGRRSDYAPGGAGTAGGGGGGGQAGRGRPGDDGAGGVAIGRPVGFMRDGRVVELGLSERAASAEGRGREPGPWRASRASRVATGAESASGAHDVLEARSVSDGRAPPVRTVFASQARAAEAAEAGRGAAGASGAGREQRGGSRAFAGVPSAWETDDRDGRRVVDSFMSGHLGAPGTGQREAGPAGEGRGEGGAAAASPPAADHAAVDDFMAAARGSAAAGREPAAVPRAAGGQWISHAAEARSAGTFDDVVVAPSGSPAKVARRTPGLASRVSAMTGPSRPERALAAAEAKDVGAYASSESEADDADLEDALGAEGEGETRAAGRAAAASSTSPSAWYGGSRGGGRATTSGRGLGAGGGPGRGGLASRRGAEGMRVVTGGAGAAGPRDEVALASVGSSAGQGVMPGFSPQPRLLPGAANSPSSGAGLPTLQEAPRRREERDRGLPSGSSSFEIDGVSPSSDEGTGAEDVPGAARAVEPRAADAAEAAAWRPGLGVVGSQRRFDHAVGSGTTGLQGTPVGMYAPRGPTLALQARLPGHRQQQQHRAFRMRATATESGDEGGSLF